MTRRIGHLHVLTDTSIQSRYSHVDLAQLAIDGGADTIQLRDKTRSTGELVEIARGIAALCKPAGVLFVVNDRADIALAAGADGVHLGQNDLPVSAARRILGDGMIIGGSASTLEEALEAQQQGADYVGFGHIYATASKIKEGKPKGPGALRDISKSLHIPVIAIGGIGIENIDEVMSSKPWGVAVIGAVCAQTEPTAAARKLRTRIDEALQS